MQIALEIPESLYLKLKQVAESDGTTVEQTLVRQVETLVERHGSGTTGEVEISYDNPRHLPRILAKTSGALPLGSENLNDYIFFPLTSTSGLRAFTPPTPTISQP